MVFKKDFSSKSFGASPVRENTWEPFIEVTVARVAEEFTGSQIKQNLSGTKAFMAKPAVEAVFDAKSR